jgi:hypothetical protein
MKSSDMITIFAEQKKIKRDRFSIVISVMAHGGVIGLMFFGITNSPTVIDSSSSQRFTMRHLELHSPIPDVPAIEKTTKSNVDPDTLYKRESIQKKAASLTDRHPFKQQQSTSRVNKVPALQTQTLAQPDISPTIILSQEITLPSVLMWDAENTLGKLIARPLSQHEPNADVKPSLDSPNREVNMADFKITASDLDTTSLQVTPSTISPVTIHGPDLINMIPETASNSANKPTPARVMSLSDLKMTEGIVPLPPGNQTAPASSFLDGKGSSTSSIRHVIPAKNGKFGIVVVGASLEELYPQTAGVWSGRLAYTVYLHVGQAKNWILQYSQPRSDEEAATGNSVHMEAPWPTDMVVPNLNGAVNTNALLVHGYLTKEGHFDKLSIVFPSQVTITKFILDTLQQWQFRPAMQNGKAALLEVLLIIPME